MHMLSQTRLRFSLFAAYVDIALLRLRSDEN
jgi:hypothetical protein